MTQRSYRAIRLTILAALGLPACTTRVEEAYDPPTKMDPPPETPPASPCEGATLVLTAGGFYTGFAKCPDGTVHRLEPTSCDATIPGESCRGNEEQRSCETSSDCTAGPFGRCLHDDAYGNLGVSACNCSYSCAEDSDCEAGSVCVCRDVTKPGSVSACARAGCTQSSDCASGECGLSTFNNGCFAEVSLACRAETDVCRLSSDCGPDGDSCAASPDSDAWVCRFTDCASGRPLLVEGAPRVAPPVGTARWALRDLVPDVGGVEPSLRAALAAHYHRVAALEHASIASFSRFTLELLALGAPPDLIAEAQRAALDEVEHAKMAYCLAGAFDGRAVGPGPLDLRGVQIHIDRAAMIAALIEEACVGETLAAAEAAALAQDIADPALRAFHERVAEDEARHAALGFRVLAWLVQSDTDSARLAARLLDRAVAAASQDPKQAGPAARRYGLASTKELGDIRRAALREIVTPCARAALGAAGPEREEPPVEAPGIAEVSAVHAVHEEHRGR